MDTLLSASGFTSAICKDLALLHQGKGRLGRVFEDFNLVAGRWKVGRKLGSGTFGTVYKASGKDRKPVAIKMERLDNKSPTLRIEAKAYEILHGTPAKAIGIPKVHYHGKHGNQEILVMDYLGDSLKNIMYLRGGRLSTKSVLWFGIHALDRIEFVHGRGLLHRDIKPANIVVGREDPKTLYLIDFGLSKRYRHPATGEHFPNRTITTKQPAGTIEFLSLNGHEGKEQSRRDDLESLGFTLVYLCRGSLPWTGICDQDRATKSMKVLSIKRKISIDRLCRKLPKEMREYFAIVRSLSFGEKPDYFRLKCCLLTALARRNRK